MIKSSKRIVCLYIVVACLILLSGCGNYPQPLASEADIKKVSADTTQISIGRLPLELYPKLSKFDKVWQANFSVRNGTGADDKRLKAFGKLALPKLRDVTLLHCPSVTDEGITALTNFSSLRSLQLEGTSVTDGGIRALAKMPSLKGINLSRCSGVTMEGLSALIASESLEGLGISAENFHTEELMKLMKQFKRIRHFQIIDSGGKIDSDKLRAIAEEKGVVLVVKREGALEKFRQ